MEILGIDRISPLSHTFSNLSNFIFIFSFSSLSLPIFLTCLCFYLNVTQAWICFTCEKRIRKVEMFLIMFSFNIFPIKILNLIQFLYLCTSTCISICHYLLIFSQQTYLFRTVLFLSNIFYFFIGYTCK